MKRLLTTLSLVVAIGLAGGITGQVVDMANGDPIAGAQVVAKTAGGDAGRAVTNDRGVYLISDLQPGVYKVVARARGYEEARYQGRVPVRGRNVTENVNFRLSPERQRLGAIAGKITDRRTGEAIAGAIVSAKAGRALLKTRSDRRGNYLLKGLKPGSYAVAARAKGYARELYPRPVPVTAGQVTKDIDFALHRTRPR